MALQQKNLPVLPGKHDKTTFLMYKKDGFSFTLEQVDSDVYEFTISMYDPDMKRHEYVLHCDRAALIDLKAIINRMVG